MYIILLIWVKLDFSECDNIHDYCKYDHKQPTYDQRVCTIVV